ncbi:DMT family transporter [Roseisalinus antarcticus]|uniref:Putative inner membrane transporter yiJE n=1 Tax=Roseisalinus antarcticus TaxID=254357 RepID=A0A1Y5RCV9_9RHOB|nr:DMT family transporter [Roseisalinus antarcticus]SLN13256.1 putative inner membrane transporter yiJE [Roseisalinus antarcticus]
MTQQTLTPRAWAELLLLSVIWGASFLSIRIALNEIGPFWVVAHRTFWAALVMWSVVALRRLPLPRGRSVWVGFLVMGLINNVLPFTLMAWGQLHIPTGLTSILNATTAIWAVILAALVFADERLTLRKALGVTTGFAGAAVAIGLATLARFDITSLAQLAVLAGTLCYALATIWARIRLRGVRAEVAAAGTLAMSAAMSVPLALLFEGPPDLSLAPQTIAAIAYYACVSTAFAYVLYYRVLGMAGSGNVALCTLLIPPTAIVLGAVVLGEDLAPRAYAGFVLLAGGLLILNGFLLPRPRVTPPSSP